MAETKDASETIEGKLVHLTKLLEDLDCYLTGEAYKDDEHCPAVVNRLNQKLNRCIGATGSITEIIHQLT